MVMLNELDNYSAPYLKDAVADSHLPMEEQIGYIREYQLTGDVEYRDIIVETNMLFVVSIAKKFHSKKLTLSDMVSAGMIGLLHAIEKFDPENGASFLTYAKWWVEQSIRKEVMDNARVVRIPTGAYRKMREVQQKVDEGWTNVDLEQAYNMSAKKVCILKMSGHEVSMQAPLTEDGFTIGDQIADEDQGLQKVQDSDEFQYILSKISSLNDREQAIIKMRFGLDDGSAKTLQEISDVYDITRERIRQIIGRAIQKLRKSCYYSKQEIYA